MTSLQASLTALETKMRTLATSCDPFDAVVSRDVLEWADELRELATLVQQQEASLTALMAKIDARFPPNRTGWCPWCDKTDSHSETCEYKLVRELATLVPSPPEAPEWRTAALLKERTRRAIRERMTAGESAESIAGDYAVPVEFVQALAAWELFKEPEPEYGADNAPLAERDPDAAFDALYGSEALEPEKAENWQTLADGFSMLSIRRLDAVDAADAAAPKEAAIRSWAGRLKTFIREHRPGRCRMFSQGSECDCPLCLIDSLFITAIKADAALREQIATLEKERDEYKAAWTAISGDNRHQLDRANRAEIALGQAQAALRAYGQHTPDCNHNTEWKRLGCDGSPPKNFIPKGGCTCGFDSALQAGAALKGHVER